MHNIFRTGRPTNFKLGIETEHKDPHQRQAPLAPRLKVKVARSRDASDRCWQIRRERNIIATPKLVGRLPTPRAIMCNSFKVKGKGEGHKADIMLRLEVRRIFRKERRTNFKLGVQMEDENPYRRDGPSPARSKVMVAMSSGAYDRCCKLVLEDPRRQGLSSMTTTLLKPGFHYPS